MAVEEVNIERWVEAADNDTQKEFREAVHTILAAIAEEKNLRADMVLKGGTLLAIRYHSHRYTKDIGLSTDRHPRNGLTPEDIRLGLLRASQPPLRHWTMTWIAKYKISSRNLKVRKTPPSLP